MTETTEIRDSGEIINWNQLKRLYSEMPWGGVQRSTCQLARQVVCPSDNPSNSDEHDR